MSKTSKILSSALIIGMMMPASAKAVTIWSDGFDAGNFNKWSYVQGADTSQGGPGPRYVYVGASGALGMAAQNGGYAAHFERPAGTTATPHAKIYKEWTTIGKLDQFRRREDPIFNGGNVTATYVAWYYFPANYTVLADWVNIFQFKEEGTDRNGVHSQNPSWWLNVGAAAAWHMGGMEPVLFANNWGNNYSNYHPRAVFLPRGRWFEVRANLYQGRRIDWYLDGRLFDSSLNATYPVGRSYYRSTGWVFGVGHYGGVGTVYVDNVQVMTAP